MKPADVDVPPGWTHAGWVDEYGNLWSLLLRNGAVESDRPVFAPPAPGLPTATAAATADDEHTRDALNNDPT